MSADASSRRLEPGPLGVAAQLGSQPGGEPVTDAHAEMTCFAPKAPLAQATARALATGVLSTDDVTLAWELARLAEPNAQTAVLVLVLAILEAQHAGSTRVSKAARDRVLAEHGTTPFGTAPAGATALGATSLGAPLVGRLGSGTPLVEDAAGVGLARWVDTERSIARALDERALALTSTPTAALESGADPAVGACSWREDVEALRQEPLSGPRGTLRLTEEQEDAVTAMLAPGTLVLTGGPGTGKTSVVVALLRALIRRGDDPSLVALAAPTGKAADRLGEAIRTALATSTAPLDRALEARLSDPTTLHRLLGYRHHDGSFRAHRYNRLAQRLVLVDEMSMIDASLFERLLSAVSPDARLVLLGDPDQLASVDPGAVLRDLLRARPRGVRFATLTRSHRMDPSDPDGAHVLSTARACLTGPVSAPADEPFATPFRVPTRDENVVGRGGAWALSAGALRATLDAWMERQLFSEDVLAPLDDVPSVEIERASAPEVVRRAIAHLARARILTVMRRTADEIDGYVSASYARWRRARVRADLPTGPAHAYAVLPGEPVMVVRNDYDEDLWNGDTGVAFRSSEGELYVSFRRGAGAVTRPLGAIAHLVERAHAVTVHKAQGSEHDEVLFVLPGSDTALSTREIVYTAITRARRSALVVGRPELLRLALARRSERVTGLVEALALTPT